MYDEEDEELIDDPISLIYEELPNDNMHKSSETSFIDLDLEDDPICLILNPKQECVDTEIVDLRSSDCENEDPEPVPRSSYGNRNFILPVTFLDSFRNVKLLKKCKPLSIKIVDCYKHPWYYRHSEQKKSSGNANCLTLGKYSNLLKHDIKQEKDDEDMMIFGIEGINAEELTEVCKSGVNVNCLTLGRNVNLPKQNIKVEIINEDTIVLENEEINAESLTTSNQSGDDKKQDQQKEYNMKNCVTYVDNKIAINEPRSLNAKLGKLDNELDLAKKSKDRSQLNFKQNSGLVGLKISTEDIETSVEKVTKKKTHKKHNKVTAGEANIKDIGMTLSNLGTLVIPVPEVSDNIEPKILTKDCVSNNITLNEPSCKSSDTRDTVNNNSNSPTRCSLKITNSKILEKVIQLKKTNGCVDKDASETNTKVDTQQKAKNIFAKDQTVPKLSLKRRPTTETEEFYIVNLNKVPNDCTTNEVIHSQEQPKVQEAVKSKSNKKKSPESLSPIIPCTTIHHKLPPVTLLTSETPNQSQTCSILPTPRSYHKKLKLKKSCLNTSNNQVVNTTDGSLASFNKVVEPLGQSPGYPNTLISNKSNSKTPKKTENNLTQSKNSRLKRPENIVNAKESIINANENGIQNRAIATHDAKVKDTRVPSVNYMQVYNEQLSENYIKEMRQSWLLSHPNLANLNNNEPDSETLKNIENNSVHNQLNCLKDTAMGRKTTSEVTNNIIPNGDVITNDANMNKKPASALNYLKKYGDPKHFEAYYKKKLKHHMLYYQPVRSNSVNNLTPIKTQVYSLPGNNTVILKAPPAHLQTSVQQTSGLPIPTVVNQKALYPSKSPHERQMTFQSPWQFPPPNTNVAYNLPNCSIPNVNMHSGSQIYPYHWQPTVSGNHYFPPSPLVLQHQKTGYPTPIQNKDPNDSVIGSTANGELIKKINIVGLPASETTLVNDKQKMLDTLNNAIIERDDFIRDMCNSKPIVEKKCPKPCPLSKKAKTAPEHSNGYSPPILPIPSYQKALELFEMKQKIHNSRLSQVESMDRKGIDINSKCDKQLPNLKKKAPAIKKRNQDKAKKISVDEYFKRVSKDDVGASKIPKRKYNKKKNAPKHEAVDNNQDLGYDSDATMKI